MQKWASPSGRQASLPGMRLEKTRYACVETGMLEKIRKSLAPFFQKDTLFLLLFICGVIAWLCNGM